MIEIESDLPLSPTIRPDNPEEARLELSLRPQKFGDFVGQTQLKKNLQIAITAAKQRSEPIEHILLYGPPGLGKTTLAHIIASEYGSAIRVTSGPAIERAGDLAALLTNLEPNDVLFIDEIHRLNKTVEEVLYPALEDRVIDLVLGKGPGARSVRMDLPPFTLVAATTRLGLLSAPLRDRFGFVGHMEYYTDEDLAHIISRSANLLNHQINTDAAMILAKRSRFTPRITNRLLKRVRDFSQVNGQSQIDLTTTEQALAELGIDQLGLDETDRKILRLIIEQFQGGPVGLNTLSASTGEEMDTISDVHEPILLKLGLLARTPKGRIATATAYTHLNYPLPDHLLTIKT